MIYNQNNYPQVLAGYNTSYDYSIKYVGCLITTFANVLQYIGINIDPVDLNEKMKANNCFQPGGAFYIPGTLSRIFPDITEQEYDGYPVDIVMEALGSKNKVVIFGVDSNAATPQTEWHWVGMYSKDQIVDPNGGVVRSILTYPIKCVKILTKTDQTINNDTMNESLIKFIQGHGGSEQSKDLLVKAILNGDTQYFDIYFPAWIKELEEENKIESVEKVEPQKNIADLVPNNGINSTVSTVILSLGSTAVALGLITPDQVAQYTSPEFVSGIGLLVTAAGVMYNHLRYKK